MKTQIDLSQISKGCPLWTCEDVMRVLKVGKTWVNDRIASGEIRVIKVGRLNRFLASDIEKFIIKSNL